MGQRQIIVTADDFGLATAVNEAVEIGHREGILGCASLMVGAAAAADAVERARRLPKLRVGLHVVVVDGRPVLPPERIPDLVDAHGNLSRRLAHAGVRYFFIPRVRRQLEAEIRAQFEAYQATGLPLDHVNAHCHLHLHPTVFAMVLRIGREYGMRAMRLPLEPTRTLRRVSGGTWRRMGGHVLLQPWVKLLHWRMRRAGLRCNAFVFGLSTTGAMTEDTLLRIVDCLPPGISEIYFHPAVGAAPAPGTAPVPHSHAAELNALVSPRVRAALTAAGIQSTSFSELG